MCAKMIYLTLALVSIGLLDFNNQNHGVAANAVTTILPQMSIEAAQADFALNLLKVCGSDNESVIISPFSIAIALSMTYAGAEGNTKKQMNEVLAKGLNDTEIHKYFGQLLADIAAKSHNYTLDSANRLYIQQNFTVKKDFLEIIKSKYAGQFLEANFAESAAVAKEINKWVEEKTHEKIKNLISADNIDHDTRLILINAIYFKGNWQIQFNKNLTKPKRFYVAENQHREIPMMSKKAHFNYLENDDLQLLGLPYENNDAYMYIVLPKQRFGLAQLEKELTGQKLLGLIDESYSQEVEVQIPKFELEKKLELVEALRKLGLSDAFDHHANFSGISDDPLYISDVIHKAFIEVSETGTEAAAATFVGIAVASLQLSAKQNAFIANHPFLYVIIDSKILFIGHYHSN